MEIDLKENNTEERWLVHLYDNGHTWVAYERSAYLLLFSMGDFINAYSILYQETGSLIFKAEIRKKDFSRLISPVYIIYDDVYHKVLDFQISPEEFQAWMNNGKMNL